MCGLCRSTWGCILWCNHVLGTGHDFWKKRCYRFHIISSLACFWLIFCCSPQACKWAPVLLEVLGSSITNTNFLVAHITLVTAIVIGFGVRWRQSCRHRQCILWGHYEAESCGQVCWPTLAPKVPQYPFLRTNPCISFSGTIEPLVLVRLLCHKNACKVAFPKAFPPHWLRLPRHLHTKIYWWPHQTPSLPDPILVLSIPTTPLNHSLKQCLLMLNMSSAKGGLYSLTFETDSQSNQHTHLCVLVPGVPWVLWRITMFSQ